MRRGTNPIEAIVVLTVVVAFVAFEIWCFLFARSLSPAAEELWSRIVLYLMALRMGN